jgi:hypothetical protein
MSDQGAREIELCHAELLVRDRLVSAFLKCADFVELWVDVKCLMLSSSGFG